MPRALLDGQILFPSNYICADDLKGRDATVTIDFVGVDNLPIQGSSKKKRSFLIGFKGKTKRLVCNKTNSIVIASLHGKEAKEWIGKTITLYPTTCKCKGETVDCIRVRPGSKKIEQHVDDDRSDEFSSDAAVDPLAGAAPNTDAEDNST